MKIKSSRPVRTGDCKSLRSWQSKNHYASSGHLFLLWAKLWGHSGHEAHFSFSRLDTIHKCNTWGQKFRNQYCLWQNVTQRDWENVTVVTVWALRYNAAKWPHFYNTWPRSQVTDECERCLAFYLIWGFAARLHGHSLFLLFYWLFLTIEMLFGWREELKDLRNVSLKSFYFQATQVYRPAPDSRRSRRGSE